MRKKRLPVERVIIDKDAFEEISDKIMKTEEELGFYMIGLVAKNDAYVLDFIEFPYSEKSSAHVASDPARAGRIFAVCPAGIRVLGTFHTHPSGIGTRYSRIDAHTWLEWSRSGIFVHCIAVAREKEISLAAYTVFDEKIYKIEYEFKNVNKDIRKVVIVFPIPFYFFYHKDASRLEIRNALEKAILREVQKACIPISFEFNGEKFSLTKKVFIYVKPNPNTPFMYEFAFPPNETFSNIRNVIIETLNLPPDTVFYIGDVSVQANILAKDIAGQILMTRSSVIAEVISKIKEIIREEISNLKEELTKYIKEIVKSELEEKNERIAYS